MKKQFCIALTLLFALSGNLSADYAAWKHVGSIFLLTTPEGANLPATARLENFPVLVRLHRDFFPFAEAKPNGEDLRWSTPTGESLAYQIEDWDAKNGTANVWVRIPKIVGNARQELKVYWGNPSAQSESNGKAVFNESNGFLSVWHMNGKVQDVVGTIESLDTGTTTVPGVVGEAKHFPGKKGIFGGEKISNYPSGSSTHSTEAWFRAEKPNTTIIGWGNEGGGRGSKIRMQLRSPPHIHIDSDFSDVDAPGRIPLGEWIHVVHTYDRDGGKIYINGKLDGSAKPVLNIKTPARFWIGGWYHNYDFEGDIDEVRISQVARSAEWIRLQYENQKPLQTLVGPLVKAGKFFEVLEAAAGIPEGSNMLFEVKALGAQKLYWTLKENGQETIVAVDRTAYRLEAKRVLGHQTLKLQFKAIYPDEVKSKDIEITIKEAIPEPEFTLQAPSNWDGRTPIEVVPQIKNLEAMRAANADKLNYTWKESGIAVIKETVPGKLLLKRSQNSGEMIVSLALHNGGQETIRTAKILVQEPESDPWVSRTPSPDEKPEEGQFYARDDRNEGTLFYRGALQVRADSVFLKLYADDKLITELSQKPSKELSYAFNVKLKPGLIKYKVEFGTKTGNDAKTLHTVGNLVCGDAYIITGQSNAVATDFGKEDPAFRSDWIRTFGSMSGAPKGVSIWGNAMHRSRDAEKLQIGYWGMELGKRIVEKHQVPVFLINGAVGGTRIDQHQRNEVNPEDMSTIYGRLLWRVRQAKLTHGIRGIFWHQGENDQGADGPTGGFGWENYRQFFIDLAASWKQDYPNVKHYYVFQIWPKSCAMGINGSDNRLREVQRTLSTAFSNLHLMSTLGVDPPGGCHFPAAGYAEFARLIFPLVERDHYGISPKTSITPPNLQRAILQAPDALVLEFDQPVKWENKLASQFYLDGEKGNITSGNIDGNKLILKLNSPLTAKTVTYLDSKTWSQATLLRGENSIAALTFCEVPIGKNGK